MNQEQQTAVDKILNLVKNYDRRGDNKYAIDFYSNHISQSLEIIAINIRSAEELEEEINAAILSGATKIKVKIKSGSAHNATVRNEFKISLNGEKAEDVKEDLPERVIANPFEGLSGLSGLNPVQIVQQTTELTMLNKQLTEKLAEEKEKHAYTKIELEKSHEKIEELYNDCEELEEKIEQLEEAVEIEKNRSITEKPIGKLVTEGLSGLLTQLVKDNPGAVAKGLGSIGVKTSIHQIKSLFEPSEVQNLNSDLANIPIPEISTAEKTQRELEIDEISDYLKTVSDETFYKIQQLLGTFIKIPSSIDMCIKFLGTSKNTQTNQENEQY